MHNSALTYCIYVLQVYTKSQCDLLKMYKNAGVAGLSEKYFTSPPEASHLLHSSLISTAVPQVFLHSLQERANRL